MCEQAAAWMHIKTLVFFSILQVAAFLRKNLKLERTDPLVRTAVYMYLSNLVLMIRLYHRRVCDAFFVVCVHPVYLHQQCVCAEPR